MDGGYPTNPLPAAAPVIRLIDELNKLPGIGPKSAQRLTYHFVRMPTGDAQSLANAILAIKELIGVCSQCQNVTDQDPCLICIDPKRDNSTLCIVEEPLDVLAIERTKIYSGLYHVLNGAISPINGIGPDELSIKELLDRLKNPLGGSDTVMEIILATNPTLEGEATAMYLKRILSPVGITITRLARGLATGSELEYADQATLSRAFDGRHLFS